MSFVLQSLRRTGLAVQRPALRFLSTSTATPAVTQSLKGRTALITGSARGLGYGIAELFAKVLSPSPDRTGLWCSQCIDLLTTIARRTRGDCGYERRRRAGLSLALCGGDYRLCSHPSFDLGCKTCRKLLRRWARRALTWLSSVT
jgi:hypothetical protein